MRAKIYLLLAALLVSTFALRAQDQTAAPKQKVKIHVKITENGETKEINREIESDTEVNVDSILRELGVMDGMELTSRGQQIEVDIKKKSAGVGEDRDVSVNVKGPRGMHYGSPGANAGGTCESKAFMGVYIQSLSDEDAKEKGLKEGKGAYITSVIEGTGAEKAGLKDGEVITKVDGKPIGNFEELIDIVSTHKPGEVVDVELYSDGHFRNVSVELGERKMEKRIAIVTPDMNWEFDGEDFDSEEFQEKMEEMAEKMKDMGQNFNWNSNEDGEGFNFDFDMEDMPPMPMNKAFLGVVPSYNEVASGVKIAEVVKGSAAEEMGLKEGDIIHKLNGLEINDFDDLVEVLSTQEPGDEVTIEVEREGSKISQKGALKSRSEANGNVYRFHKPLKIEKEVKVFIEIADITEEDAEELNSNTNLGVKPESDLAIRSLQFAPNPNDGDFNLTFDLPEKANTEIKMYDSNGRQVYYEMLGNFTGKYSNRINISDEPNGIYFLVITQGKQQFSKKIIKQ